MNILLYIDTGTITLIYQILAGVIIALAAVFGIWWRKITTFIRSLWFKIFGKKKKDDEVEPNNEALSEIYDDETADETSEVDETSVADETSEVN